MSLIHTDRAMTLKSALQGRLLFVLTLLFGVLTVFAIHALDFPGSVPNFQNVSGGGVLLDAKPSFSEEEIYERLTGYGEEGRNNYSFRNVSVDVLLPLAILPGLFLLMLHALKGSTLSRAMKALLYSFAFVYVIFDLAENGAVLALLAHYPDRMPRVAALLPYLTVTKRIASLLAIGAPLVIFGIAFFRKP